jgi:hypothetical protein
MGGAVGHLQHLYDDRNLTFDEIQDILTSAATGKLEKVSEKLDGLNLVFSWDVSSNLLKVARAGGDIKRGGMDAKALASKFAGRGNLTEAFTFAFHVLNESLVGLPKKVKLKIFGPRSNRWYSVEIIYAANPNVINYNSNNVVFHRWPVFSVSKSGKVQMTTDDLGGFDLLTKHIDRMQKSISMKDWNIQGPTSVKLKNFSNLAFLNNVLVKIKDELSTVGLSGNSTIREYLGEKIRRDAERLNLQPHVVGMLIERCLAEPGSPTLVQIKKNANKSDHDTINDFVRNSLERMKSYVLPIELAINDFAIELLKGLESTFVNNAEEEVLRLRNQVAKAISTIESSGDETAMSILKNQMNKLKSLENITSPVEGVVFIYKGNAYKFTGSFSSANQILGLFKYGRKGSVLNPESI